MKFSSLRGSRAATTKSDAPPPKRYARIAPLYKAMIWTSFGLNLVLFAVVITLGWFIFTQSERVTQTVGTVQAFAGNNVAELQDVVAKLEDSTIIYTVPLTTRLPVELEVPINSSTILNERNIVTLTEPVPLNVPASIVFPGGGGNLNATVNIQLPPGLQLPVNLDMNVRLQTEIPIDNLEVPVNIPLAETELGPQFRRLGAIVDRLVEPAAPLLILPETPPDSSRPDAAHGPDAPAPAR